MLANGFRTASTYILPTRRRARHRMSPSDSVPFILRPRRRQIDDLFHPKVSALPFDFYGSRRTSENVMRILLILALLLLAFTSAQANDGDTLTINGITYRLDGIDAPELDQNCIDEVGEVYPCGQLAHKVIQQFIAERPIHCDDLGPDPKYPQRRIGHCTTDGVDLHHWLVKEGWAINFEPYARGRFKDDEREAREARLGIWKGCFVNPQDFRRWNKHTASLIGPTCTPDARGTLLPDHAQMPRG